MAKRKTQKQKEADERMAVLRQIGLAVAIGAWLIVIASLVSYNAADAPSHAVGVPNANTANWMGPLGAAIAHKAYFLIGPGVWVAMIGLGAWLVLTLANRPVNQAVIRATGLAIMTVTTSGMIAMATTQFVAGYDGRPEGPGGLLGVFIQEEIAGRFATAGGLLILGIAFWIGALLAVDQIVLAIPRVLAEAAMRVMNVSRERFPGMPEVNLPRWKMPRLAGLGFMGRGGVVQRENDLDGGRIELPSKSKKKRKAKRNRHGDFDDNGIDEDAGGLGGAEPIEAVEDDEYEYEYVYEDEDEEDADDEDISADAPSAYVNSKKKFDPDALRAKMAQMPINFAKKQDTHEAPIREMDLTGYQFPDIDMLEDPDDGFSDEMRDIIKQQGEELQAALLEYKIKGEIVNIDSGPVITLFEIKLAPGTKVSRITAVDSDLARALKAPNIRVVPNMAGKNTIGIEVPNLKKERVRLKELMSVNREAVAKMKLPMFLGKDASGNPLVQDLNAMPHMLIAGTTGSGKSVCMNSIIMSFLFTKRPDELKLVLVDPKMVEMSMFKSIPHLMCPVVTEMNKAAQILEWAVTKMDERYELLAEVGVRDIATYNDLGWEEIKDRLELESDDEAARIPKKLPYLVFVIDELADLMMTNKEVEGSIVRIAQKARAVGIHLILATQRPQANVVTGLIKSNMPSRVCMKVASGMDSRIVLDAKGGELLLGHGDMLFLSPRSSDLVRAQGTLVDDSEIRKSVKFLKTVSQQSFEPQLVQIKNGGDTGALDEERDELFNDAVLVVLETGRGSVSLLQRRLTIGYSRASRMIEQMEASGILGHHKTAQAREVLISPEEWEAMKEMIENDIAEGNPVPAPGNAPVNDPGSDSAAAVAVEEADAEVDEDDAEVKVVDETAIEVEDEEDVDEDDEEYEYEEVDEADEGDEGEEEEYEEEDEDPNVEMEYEEVEEDDEEWEDAEEEDEDEGKAA
ncbi:MAG: DNA translocase FtsK 4TM domain-containing protein [Planctomycetota bacterium]